MGQHKYNLTAIAAKEGKLPPKPPRMSKRERDRAMRMAALEAMERLKPGMGSLIAALGTNYGEKPMG